MKTISAGIKLLLVPVLLCTFSLDFMVLCHDTHGGVSLEVATFEGECVPSNLTGCEEGLSPGHEYPGSCVVCVDIPFRSFNQINIRQLKQIRTSSGSKCTSIVECVLLQNQGKNEKVVDPFQYSKPQPNINDSLRSTILII